MRRWKKALVSLLGGCLMLGMVSTGVSAAQAGTYTYTITLSAGNMGTISGQEKTVYTGAVYGESWASFDLSQVQVTDERYYVKGVRLSGRDNADALAAPAFRVTGDADYVVAYGVRGDQVAYTVQYQDEDGETLAASQTFYGNVGDKPVVAYRYVDGYIPQSLALTKTLSANEAENIFTFVYTQGDPDTIVRTETETTVVTGEPSVITVVAGAPAAAGTAAGGTAAGGTGTGGAADAGDGTAAGEVADGGTEAVEEEPVPEGTQDIVDLDEEETPLGDLEIEDNTGANAEGLSMVGSVAVAAAAGVILICLIVYLMKKRRSGSDETEE
mgnify:CR=1 FL=1